MSNTELLKARNANFAASFSDGELAPLPRLGMVIVACIDARVDPTKVFGLELGDAVLGVARQLADLKFTPPAPCAT